MTDTQYKKNETQYVDISTDKSLSELKKQNQLLYDSIKKLSDVKEAIQIKYVTRYSTDTIKIDKSYQEKDSTYHYAQNTDTISYKLDINGNNVKWFKLGFSINDSLMIVTRSKNGQNETTITHSSNTSVTNTTLFVPKKSFGTKLKEHLYFGVGVGAGYGLINNKPDIYVGVSTGYKF